MMNNKPPDILQPFSEATVKAMEILANVNVEEGEVYSKANYSMKGCISGLIYLRGKVERMLAVTFSRDSARALAIKVLAGAIEDPSHEVLADCVGELVNIIAGQVKGEFVHTDNEFDISTPSIVTGEDHEIRHRAGLPCYVMTFESDIGQFAVQLCMREEE
jgi:chemotaxis protein CheX